MSRRSWTLPSPALPASPQDAVPGWCQSCLPDINLGRAVSFPSRYPLLSAALPHKVLIAKDCFQQHTQNQQPLHGDKVGLRPRLRAEAFLNTDGGPWRQFLSHLDQVPWGGRDRSSKLQHLSFLLDKVPGNEAGGEISQASALDHGGQLCLRSSIWDYSSGFPQSQVPYC